MTTKEKTCENCGKRFDIKDKGRLVLEGWKDEKHLSRLYFCSRHCFSTFMREKKFI